MRFWQTEVNVRFHFSLLVSLRWFGGDIRVICQTRSLETFDLSAAIVNECVEQGGLGWGDRSNEFWICSNGVVCASAKISRPPASLRPPLWD